MVYLVVAGIIFAILVVFVVIGYNVELNERAAAAETAPVEEVAVAPLVAPEIPEPVREETQVHDDSARLADVVSALKNMGYKKKEAEYHGERGCRATPSGSVEEAIMAAFRSVNGKLEV